MWLNFVDIEVIYTLTYWRDCSSHCFRHCHNFTENYQNSLSESALLRRGTLASFQNSVARSTSRWVIREASFWWLNEHDALFPWHPSL